MAGAPSSRAAGWLQRQWWRSPPGAGARLLQPLSWLYAMLAARQRRLAEAARPPALAASAARGAPPATVPVVVVGNLIVGGAGKTPTVIAVVRLLQRAGWHPGVISRGYGRSGDGVAAVSRSGPARDMGDEPLLIHLRAAVPVFVGRDRVAALQALRAAHPEIDVVVSDDGLQHHRLRRDAQVIVFDERGAGNGLLLPAGPLREPLPATVPPGSVVLYNAPAASTPLPGWVARRRLSGVTPLAAWWAGEPARPLSTLQGRPLLAAAGIASPERFFAMLEDAGLVITRLPLPDHYGFADLPWPAGAADVVMTEKDAVKLRPERLDAAPRVWVATLDFEPPPGFGPALQRLLPPPPAPSCPS